MATIMGYWPLIVLLLYVAVFAFLGWALVSLVRAMQSIAQSLRQIADGFARRE